jgi:hypothetical protein
MDFNTVVVCLAIVAAAVYVVRLLVREGGDFEAGGRAGSGEFFVKAKTRKR